MKLRTIAFAAAILLCRPAAADHDKPRHDWGDEAYYCETYDKALSEEDFIRSALGHAWGQHGAGWRDEWRTPEDWLAVMPDCCSAQIRGHQWELEERHTKGLTGWLNVLLSTPTIFVGLTVPERDRYNPEKWRTIIYLLNICGGDKDSMG